MAKEKYIIFEENKPEFPVRNVVQSRDGKIVFSVFGPKSFYGNVEGMNQFYSHPRTGEKMSFREPTTQKSIALASYDFENFAKPKIFDPKWLQAGRHVKTQEGVFTNTTETDEKVLMRLLNGVEKVNGIYLIDNKGAFIPYDSFKQGVMSSEEFCEQGLARGLEHTSGKKARKLASISKNYSNGVWVGGWDSVREPIEKFSVLGSVVGGTRLNVGGIDWGGYGYGFAFGLLEKNRGKIK